MPACSAEPPAITFATRTPFPLGPGLAATPTNAPRGSSSARAGRARHAMTMNGCIISYMPERPGVLARMPIDPAAALGQASVASLEELWGPGAHTRDTGDGWRTLEWQQSWFGEPVNAAYTFGPGGLLQRIDLYADRAEGLSAGM